MKQKPKKIYCYVDETGQDVGSDYFVVVTVISEEEQTQVREKLLEIEKQTKVGIRKWHKSVDKIRQEYLKQVTKLDLSKVSTFFGKYEKPLPFFLPILETISKAIKKTVRDNYKAIIYIDGIDKKKALELTNALRLEGIKTDHIRSVRDESEPFIRLADRWAGCIRASEYNQSDKEVVIKAEKSNKLKSI